MSDDLVKVLRGRCNCNMLSSPCGSEDECRFDFMVADHIEELSNCVAVLEAKLSEQEALLAKAVKSLEAIEDASRFFARDRESSDTETLSYAHETTRRLCATPLAEIKGEK